MSSLVIVTPSEFQQFADNIKNSMSMMEQVFDEITIEPMFIHDFPNKEIMMGLAAGSNTHDILSNKHVLLLSSTTSQQGLGEHNASAADMIRNIGNTIRHQRRCAKDILSHTLMIPASSYNRSDKIIDNPVCDIRETPSTFYDLQGFIQAGTDRIIQVDAHNPNLLEDLERNNPEFSGIVQEYKDKLVYFEAIDWIADTIYKICEKNNLNIDQVCLISPDKGRQPVVQKVADLLGTQKILQFDKIRTSGSTVESTISNPELIQEYPDHHYFILDDIISTGGTQSKTIEKLKEQHIQHIHIIVTFSECIQHAMERIAVNRDMIRSITASNLHPRSEKLRSKNLIDIHSIESFLASQLHFFYKDMIYSAQANSIHDR